MTTAANVTAKKGDTILRVSQCGTTREETVVSWGKKRATLVGSRYVGTICEPSKRYHLYLENGEIVHEWPIERMTCHYRNI
jgi:hypothetical protein